MVVRLVCSREWDAKNECERDQKKTQTSGVLSRIHSSVESVGMTGTWLEVTQTNFECVPVCFLWLGLSV
ncbi:hypothetical protein SCLCIDRAFT_1212942 [Scleroderma citrinum Foug A]|uniref:Uncharacterized protein n=1 Tax=Scleroderma citrinum Foug A TaxID=1036808 RepID=A0A0C3DW99_9AGAM|nr:hypothetical protein SCLCIDRAFT_1212942 [Scleroderma citrinum Foug A]